MSKKDDIKNIKNVLNQIPKEERGRRQNFYILPLHYALKSLASSEGMDLNDYLQSILFDHVLEKNPDYIHKVIKPFAEAAQNPKNTSSE